MRVARVPQGRLGFHQLLDGRVEIDHVILGQRGRQLIGHCLQNVFIKIFQTLQGECVGVAADQVLFGVQGDVVALIENPHIHQFPGLLMLQLDRVTVTDGGLHQRLGEGDAHRREIHERETLFCNRLRQIGPGIFLVDGQHLGNLIRQRVVLAGAKRNQRAVLIIQVDDAGGDLRRHPQPVLFTGAQTRHGKGKSMVAVGDLGAGQIHQVPFTVGQTQGAGKIFTVRLTFCLGGSLINGTGKSQQQLAAQGQIHHAVRRICVDQRITRLRRDKHIRVVFTGIEQGIKQT